MSDARTLLRASRLHDEAEIILARLLRIPRFRLYTDDIPVPEAIEHQFHELMTRRTAHTPLQYLIRTGNFFELELAVDQRVFIPRPETEELIARIVSRITNPKIIFDLCTGSGAIAIALARAYPEAVVIATDISKPALAVARLNIERYRLGDRIMLYPADLFDFPESRTYQHRVDLIVSNPPYIPTGDIQGLMAEVRDFEPRIALDGGPDGLHVIKPIIERATDFLKPDGLLALEIDPGLVAAISALTPRQPVFEKDLLGRDRYMFMHASQRSADDTGLSGDDTGLSGNDTGRETFTPPPGEPR